MDCNVAWAAEKRTKVLDSPGEGRVFSAYPKRNVWLTSYFGVAMTRLARVLRHFCARFAANSCQSEMVERITGMRPGMPDSEFNSTMRQFEIIPCNLSETLGVDGPLYGLRMSEGSG
jgi:hypothetical protein